MEYAVNLSTRKYPKAVICFILCLAVLCLTFYADYQNVHAFFPLIILGIEIAPEVVAAGAALLTAAGITFASSPDAQNAVYNYFAHAGPNLINNVKAMGTGIAAVSDSVWNSVTSWVSSTFTVGTNNKSLGVAYYGPDGYPVSGTYNNVFPLGNTVVFGSDVYTMVQGAAHEKGYNSHPDDEGEQEPRHALILQHEKPAESLYPGRTNPGHQGKQQHKRR